VTQGARRHLALSLAVAAAAAALYLPFLGNPLVFDDRIFFSGQRFAYYATHPLGADLRLPAYFSLAATQALWGSLAAHRILSLVLHVVVALLLYRLLLDAQRAALRGASESDFALRSAIGAAAFALHPVAVYGAGYLVQRSIVLATLFGLVAAILYLRGLRRRSHADALSAALFYWLAVLSKEHAVLLPAALLPLALLAGAERRFSLRHAALFVAACAPAAVFVVLRSLHIIGGAYEAGTGAVAAQIAADSAAEILEQSLALSAVTQAGLFFKYVGLWLWPDPGALSIDVRVDFAAGWTPGWVALKVAGFVACGALAAGLAIRGGALGIAGFGLLYAWILYFVQFSAVQFQEPFVLYRSYLWGPGMICIAVASLTRLPRRGAMAVGLIALAALAAVAHGRLVTFSDALRLWEDAAAKLPEKPVPWGSRTLYGLGREYLYANRPDEALATAERCVRLYPKTVHCVYARGAVRLQRREFALAAGDLRRALEFEPRSGIIHHRLGLALECQGRIGDAQASYRAAQALGFGGAVFELQRLQSASPRPPPACG
jgi:tetratricopeptide (TPR) repeat protein